MGVKAFIAGLCMAVAAAVAGAGLAQDKPPQQEELAAPPKPEQAPADSAAKPRQEPAPAEAEAKPPRPPVDPKLKRLAQDVIEQALKASRAPEIFADLRRTLKDVYIPIMREMVQGGFPGAPEADAATAASLAKALTYMDYLRKAGDELDAALSENREAMISDVAEEIARSADESTIGDLKRMMGLPAVGKAMDAAYASSKLVTGFTYEDSRKLSEFSAWANNLSMDIAKAMPGTDGPKTAPSSKKMLKAQALMDEILRASHLDEMVSETERFAREVYAEAAPLSEEDREELVENIERFEFLYNMQKAIVVGIAPSVLAAALTDGQLDTMRDYVRSPAFTKAFDLTRNAIKAGTAFTKEDILEARKALDDLDKKAKLREKNAGEGDAMRADWPALIQKWTETLKARISPETRKGLEQSFQDLQLRDPPI